MIFVILFLIALFWIFCSFLAFLYVRVSLVRRGKDYELDAYDSFKYVFFQASDEEIEELEEKLDELEEERVR